MRAWPIAVLALVVSSTAFADDKATAEILFNEGQRLLQSGKYAEACPKLADSQRLDPGIGTALYLGDCWEKVNKLASAWGSFREAVSLAERANDKRAAVAKRHADRLEPTLSRLTIKLASDVPPGAKIERNGKPVASSEIGLAIPMDGGACTITADVAGRERWSTTVNVPDRDGSVQVVVHAGAKPEAAGTNPSPTPTPNPNPTPVPETPTPEPGGGGGMSGMKIAGLGIAGAGVVALGIGTGLAIAAKGTYDGSNAVGKCDAVTNFCTPQGLSERSSAHGQADVATVLFIAGGVLAAGGVVLFFVAPKKQAAFVPAVAPNYAGASFSMRF